MTQTPTRGRFLAEYRRRLVATWHPESVAKNLDSFMGAVERTIAAPSGPASWVWDAPMSKAAFRAIGAKGPFTLKALRALPVEG